MLNVLSSTRPLAQQGRHCSQRQPLRFAALKRESVPDQPPRLMHVCLEVNVVGNAPNTQSWTICASRRATHVCVCSEAARRSSRAFAVHSSASAAAAARRRRRCASLTPPKLRRSASSPDGGGPPPSAAPPSRTSAGRSAAHRALSAAPPAMATRESHLSTSSGRAAHRSCLAVAEVSRKCLGSVSEASRKCLGECLAAAHRSF